MKIICYADGSSLGNPGRGGCGYIFLDEKENLISENGAGYSGVTNNQMELCAVLMALKDLQKMIDFTNIEFRLDSEYVMKGITTWSKTWINNGWRTANKKEVLNKSLWQKILSEIERLEDKKIKISFTHVYGHTGEKWNEKVDELAKKFAEKGGQKLDV